MIKFRLNFIFKVLLALSVFSVAASAATLAEYRENIQHFKGDLTSLIYPGENQTDADEQEFIQTVADELPKLFPSKETIEFDNSAIETNNDWIINKFATYKDLEKNSPERREILAELYERLDAIERKLDELETATASARTKDEDKQKLGEILKRAEYSKPEQEEESTAASAFKRFREWLKNLFPTPDAAPAKTPEGFQAIPFFLQIVIYLLLLALIGFLIYKFAPFLISRIKTRERSDKRERVILGEKIADDERSETLFGDAERLAQNGDLRGAIRKGYIALLCELSDRKVIGLSNNKTNRDYLRDVRKRRELHQNMSGLTNDFEKHWYGFQETTETDWSEFKEGYQKAVKSN